VIEVFDSRKLIGLVLRRTSDDLRYKTCFGFGVPSAISAEAVGEMVLELSVLAGRLGMGTQVIAKDQVAIPELAPGLCEVQVVRFRIALTEEKSARHPGFPTVLVAEQLQGPDAALRVSKAAHAHHDVEYGLGSKARHRGAPNMLDALRPRPKGALDAHAFFVEERWPRLVV
jgi:hypothetical protein